MTAPAVGDAPLGWDVSWGGAGVRGALRAVGRLPRIAGLAARTIALSGRGEPGPERAAALLSEAAGRALEIHGLEVQVSGSPPRGPALVVANHVSYLDPLVLVSKVGCVPISKAEVASWPVFGAVARRTGVLFVERSSTSSRREVLRAAWQVLREGGLVLNFPEGTTTDGSTVLPFRKGLFDVARRVGVDVIPAALRYHPGELAWTGDATFLPHYLRFAALDRCAVELSFGAPITPQAYAGAEELARAARDGVASLLEDRVQWLRKAR
jgi:lyso-ornithine lipid O-acyltransferase